MEGVLRSENEKMSELMQELNFEGSELASKGYGLLSGQELKASTSTFKIEMFYNIRGFNFQVKRKA